jgi:hypothetical protein
MIRAERAYRMLLRAYPERFRAAFGREMTTVFRDRGRELRASPIRFWAEVLIDVARSAPALRLEAARAGMSTRAHDKEVVMIPMAILAVLVGAMEVVNTLVEVAAGGLTNRSALALAAIVLAILAGAALLIAGISMLRRSPRSPVVARTAAVICLTTFALIGLLQPMLSALALLLGIGFPIVLLIFFATSGGRGDAPPKMA